MTRPLLYLILFCTPLLADTPSRQKLLSYRSPVDGSLQEYGIYIPDGPPPAGGFPVVLHAHGYGWWVGTGFSDWQMKWADEKHWLLVQLNARGPNFYWGIGDVATREVVDDLDLRFGVNRKRVYITGASMGGTGAFRQGIVNPDLISAAVGVDGWTDYHEWHWHWYARKEQRDDIEEFRRPLLEASSPVFISERAQLGDVWVIADGRDDIVYPWQECELHNRRLALSADREGQYAGGLTIHYEVGHGGGYDLNWIYDYFLKRLGRPERGSFRVATTVLNHGELYWGRMERLHHQGEQALLECSTQVEGNVGLVDVLTRNLDGLTLHICLSPVADSGLLRVTVDGIPAYVGPPQEVSFEALRDGADKLTGWEWQPRGAGDEALAFRKSPDLPGPLGDAFVKPFVVCYGTLGSAAATTRHREEAEAFAAGWNGFMVHGEGVRAVPEDQITEPDLQRANVVIYGTLDTSRLLRRAHTLHPLPVEVWGDRVVVRDPLTGDREYRGAKYGIFFAYPNPLADGRKYLVVCSGRYATQPDGSSRQGLEFDLEKLYWGYSDYVIFNTDFADLPHVMNVNNKPPVTCYEAGYFVEAGYFDQDWKVDRGCTAERVRRTRPPRGRLLHVSEVRVSPTTLSVPVPAKVDGPPQDPPRTPLAAPALEATVRVVDEAGAAVVQARVSGSWVGGGYDTLSRATLSDGVAHFPYPASTWPTPLPRFRVLNVMATGAEHDFSADALEGSAWEDANLGLAARPAVLRQLVDNDSPATVALDLANLRDAARTVRVQFIPPGGGVPVGEREWRLAPGERVRLSVTWVPQAGLPGGRHPGRWLVSTDEGGLTANVELILPRPRPLPVRLMAVEGKAIQSGEPYEVKARLSNLDPTTPQGLRLACSLVGTGRRLAQQQLRLAPGETAEVVWTAGPGEAALAVGEYRGRVTVLGVPGMSDECVFTVREP